MCACVPYMNNSFNQENSQEIAFTSQNERWLHKRLWHVMMFLLSRDFLFYNGEGVTCLENARFKSRLHYWITWWEQSNFSVKHEEIWTAVNDSCNTSCNTWRKSWREQNSSYSKRLDITVGVQENTCANKIYSEYYIIEIDSITIITTSVIKITNGVNITKTALTTAVSKKRQETM